MIFCFRQELSLFYNMCSLFPISCFLPFAFNSFAIDNCISCYVFFLFLPKFINFYLRRYKTKNRIRSKKTRCKKYQKARNWKQKAHWTGFKVVRMYTKWWHQQRGTNFNVNFFVINNTFLYTKKFNYIFE